MLEFGSKLLSLKCILKINQNSYLSFDSILPRWEVHLFFLLTFCLLRLLHLQETDSLLNEELLDKEQTQTKELVCHLSCFQKATMTIHGIILESTRRTTQSIN